MTRQACASARHGDAVVARQREPAVEKLVHLLAETSIAAVNGGGAHAALVKRIGALENLAIYGLDDRAEADGGTVHIAS